MYCKFTSAGLVLQLKRFRSYWCVFNCTAFNHVRFRLPHCPQAHLSHFLGHPSFVCLGLCFVHSARHCGLIATTIISLVHRWSNNRLCFQLDNDIKKSWSGVENCGCRNITIWSLNLNHGFSMKLLILLVFRCFVFIL